MLIYREFLKIQHTYNTRYNIIFIVDIRGVCIDRKLIKLITVWS